jgi:hypothetical protein
MKRKYRVIHKSVKHFKNSQQINYSSDRGTSYADREWISPDFLKARPHRPARASQSNFATNLDRTHRTSRWRFNPVATPVPRLFLLGVCEGHCLLPPLPANLRDLRNRITAAVALVNRDMQTRVWDIV